MDGNESIYGGMTPMAAMAMGDRARMLIFPMLLGRMVGEREIETSFRFTYFVPDWGSDEVERGGEGGLNLSPKGRTYQYQADPEGCHAGRAEHWETVFEEQITPLREAMTKAEVKVAGVSTLRDNADFRAVLRMALQTPQAVREVLLEAMPETEIMEEPLQFAGPVCRTCHSINGRMTYVEGWDRIQFLCAACGNEQEADIQEQEYWLHEYVLDAAVTAALQPNVTIVRGGPRSEAEDAAIDALVARAVKDSPTAPSRLVVPRVDSERGGLPLERLVDLAKEWDEVEVELA